MFYYTDYVGVAAAAVGVIMACSRVFDGITDTIEYGEWKTGIRTEGLINSAASFGQKIGNGISLLLVGAVLTISQNKKGGNKL